MYAARAKFRRPILHGLATCGVAAVAIDRASPGTTLKTIDARFSNLSFRTKRSASNCAVGRGRYGAVPRPRRRPRGSRQGRAELG
ncbi:hypothetical protein ACSMXM_10945 [Pacificimonas sp. ICDLI1SI03]